jgi:hypothetical protein
MSRVSRTMVVLAGTLVLTLSGGPSALTFTGSGPRDDDAGAAGADALTLASATALTATGGSWATATEHGNEECYYEVHVTLDDGRQVDVHLDESFAVVSGSAHVEDSAENAGFSTEEQLRRRTPATPQGDLP